ncbi:IS3-Spn1 transposase [Streptococcus pneumoniae]|nr:IS3-Spn1 transposase [Streptococcus pneumoniae]
MIEASKLKAGMTFETADGKLIRVLEASHHKPGKGNSQDNGRMESFFGILKSEMFYGYEKTFKSLNQLEQAIIDYIDY